MFWKIATVVLLLWCASLTAYISGVESDAARERYKIGQTAGRSYDAVRAVDSQLLALVTPHLVDRIGQNRFDGAPWADGNRTEWFKVEDGRVQGSDLWDFKPFASQIVMDRGNDLMALHWHRQAVGLQREKYMRQQDLTFLEMHQNRWIPEEYRFYIDDANPEPWRTMKPDSTH
jgi:hypothetical protein